MMSVTQMLNSIAHGLGNCSVESPDACSKCMLFLICTYYRNSPVKYPTPSYAGPPIPIDFGDSSFECDSSPEKMSRLEDSTDIIIIVHCTVINFY